MTPEYPSNVAERGRLGATADEIDTPWGLETLLGSVQGSVCCWRNFFASWQFVKSCWNYCFCAFKTIKAPLMSIFSNSSSRFRLLLSPASCNWSYVPGGTSVLRICAALGGCTTQYFEKPRMIDPDTILLSAQVASSQNRIRQCCQLCGVDDGRKNGEYQQEEKGKAQVAR